MFISERRLRCGPILQEKIKKEKMRMKKISVAIDGPAGAGKSSVASNVAKQLGYVYIDTGAMYRSVAVYAIQNGIKLPEQTDRLIQSLKDISISFSTEKGVQRILLNGCDVTERIRESDASMGSSCVAAIPEVRKMLVARQKEMGADGGVIMDGRDIGTTVLPDAELKVYLTASVEERAERRYRENLERGIECDLERIKKDVMARDENDMNRAVSPLRRADDAILLDTSDMTFESVVSKLSDMVKEREKNVL